MLDHARGAHATCGLGARDVLEVLLDAQPLVRIAAHRVAMTADRRRVGDAAHSLEAACELALAAAKLEHVHDLSRSLFGCVKLFECREAGGFEFFFGVRVHASGFEVGTCRRLKMMKKW